MQLFQGPGLPPTFYHKKDARLPPSKQQAFRKVQRSSKRLKLGMAAHPVRTVELLIFITGLPENCLTHIFTVLSPR